MQHIAGHAGLSDITCFFFYFLRKICFFKAQQESTVQITTHLHSAWQENPSPTPSLPVLEEPLAAKTKNTKFTKKIGVTEAKATLDGSKESCRLA